MATTFKEITKIQMRGGVVGNLIEETLFQDAWQLEIHYSHSL